MDRYLLDRMLGKGNFGSVYKVIDAEGKDIALKVIDIKSDRHLQEAKKEIDFLTMLKPCQPSLICYYKSFVKDEQLFIETEYIDGPTLHEFAKKNRLNANFLNNLLAIIGDLIPGIKYLHSKNIIHRDIKPENIVIEKTKTQPKLIDVGLACLSVLRCNLDTEFCCLGTQGTGFFMSPESLKGTNYPESDVWSLGATIYNAATGKYLVDEKKVKNYEELQYVMRTKPIMLEKTGNKILDNLIQRMLKTNHKERITLDEIYNTIIESKLEKPIIEVEIIEEPGKIEIKELNPDVAEMERIRQRYRELTRIDEYFGSL